MFGTKYIKDTAMVWRKINKLNTYRIDLKWIKYIKEIHYTYFSNMKGIQYVNTLI